MGLRFLSSLFLVGFLSGCGLKLGVQQWDLQKSSKMLAVTTTNYQSGALAILDIENRLARLEFSPIFPDAIVKSFSGLTDIFVINRLGADNIQRIDRATGKTIQQFSVGQGTNPQDLILVGDNAYVSCLESAELLKVNLEAGSIKSRINLMSFSDSDGSPEASWMELHEKELWVQLQRLDRKNSFSPIGLSQIAIFNTGTDQVIQVINLKATNPVTPFKRSAEGQWLVAEAGFVGRLSKLDGGIERIDPFKKESLGFITTEAQLGGDLVDFECLNKEECLAIISKPQTELVLFDVKTGAKLRSLWLSSGYDLRQLVRDPEEGLIYVVDGNPYQPKIRVWDESTLQQRLDLNWNLELPPYQITFLK
ncbi:MAG: YncE family protein [Pseudomonadota bacterium]